MSSFVRGLVEVVVGIAAVALIIVAPYIGIPLSSTLISILSTAGAGLAIAGMGTLINGTGGQGGSGVAGVTIATQGGIQPWRYVYGPNVRVGGDLVYKHQWGDNDKFRDEVYILACHPTQAVRRLLLNNQFVQIDPSDGTSFTPVQQTVNIASITRANNVVTVVLNANIPYADVGVDVYIENVTGDHSLNGKVMIDSIVSQVFGSPGSLTFTYLSGGTAVTFSGQGQVKTSWPDYGRKVYMEVLNGTQTSTFNGMLSGTGYDGDLGNIVNDGSNPWTADCVAYGHTAVMLRWHYNDTYFAQGMPTVAFIVDGKSDIYDPRTGTTRFTGNAALCAADWASNTECGLSYAYHTEIPDTELIAAANICDETVALAGGGTTSRYVCSGQFTVATLPGTVFLNMLTACAGHYTNTSGQLIIWPGVWRGTSPTVINDLGQYSGPFEWSPKPSPRELYNGVKGTFYSPSNRWQLSDFPAYIQDYQHGYNIGDTSLAAYSGDANLRDDQNQRLYLDIQLPFTPTAEMCQRIAKIELMRRRAFGVGTFRLNMTAFPVTPMDVVAMTNAVLGWTSKLLEVSAKRFALTKQSDANTGAEAMALGVELDVVSTAANNYSWDPNEALTPQGYRSSQLPTNTFPDLTSPPSQIQNFVITGGFPTYTTSTFTLKGTGDFPVALNNFAGCQLWNVLGGDFDHPIPLGDMPVQEGATNWKWAVTAPIPDVDQTWQIYAVTYGVDPITGLVVSGPWLPVTSPTINETPHVTVAISANVPGNVTGLSFSVDNTDPLVSRVTLTSTVPSPLHDFDGVEIWDQDITGGVTDYPHDYGVAKWSGSGSLVTIVEIPRLAYSASVKIWEVSRNEAITETPVFTGGGASPNVTVTIPARGSTAGPPAVNVGTITPTVVYSSAANDGANHWGVTGTIAAPSGGWGTVDRIQVDIFGPTGGSGAQLRTMFPIGKSDLPSGTTTLTFNASGIAEFDRPIFGTTETYYLKVTVFNADGNATATPTQSATFNVIGGGTDTPAPVVTSISNTVAYEGSDTWITSVFTLPSASFQFISLMEMRIITYVGLTTTVEPNGNGLIGKVAYWDFNSSNNGWNAGAHTFTFVHGPYPRPPAQQYYAVGAITTNGHNDATLPYTISSQILIDPVTTTASVGLSTICTGLSGSQSGLHTVDGTQLAIINLGFTFPTSDEVKAVWIVSVDLIAGIYKDLRQYPVETYPVGASVSVQFDVPPVATTYRIFWYSINSDGDVMSPQPFVDVVVTATTGQLKVGRADPTHLTPELQLDSSSGSPKLGIAGMAVDKLRVGQLTVQITLVSAGAGIIVTGTGFVTTINTTVGVQVFSSTNNQIAALTAGYLRVTGTGGNTAFTGQFDATQVFLGHTNGSFARIMGNNGAGGFANFVDQFGNSCLIGAQNVHLQSAGSVVIVNGQYKMYIGGVGAPQTVLDINGRLCGLDAGPVTIGGTAFPRSLQCVVGGVVRQIGTS